LIPHDGKMSDYSTGAADHFRWTWTAVDEATETENSSPSTVA
jgi:hypothetical protein